MITGYPISLAKARASSTSAIVPSLPGTTGRPASRMVRRATALSPIARIMSAAGPMNVKPHEAHTSAKWALSDRNPYPGWIASAPVTSAAEMSRAMWL